MKNDASILIVDDEWIVCKTIALELAKHGFSVTEAYSGDDAVKELQKNKFNVVITDLIMEGIDGLGVIEVAKKLSAQSSVIAITGYGKSSLITEAAFLGAESILIKPFDIDELISKVESCLSMKNFMRYATKNTGEKKVRTSISMAIDEEFQRHISYLDLNFINESQDVIYIIDADFVLKAYNKAWVDFARSNNGDEVLVKYPIGSNILDAIEGPLKLYTVQAFEKALRGNKPFEHNYKCPSAVNDRVFRQSAYPLKEGEGLVVSNHLVLEGPLDVEPQEFNKRFIDDKGLIRQCSCCRRIKDPIHLAWLWVPSLVKDPFPATSHGICPQCLNHYYPDIE